MRPEGAEGSEDHPQTGARSVRARLRELRARAEAFGAALEQRYGDVWPVPVVRDMLALDQSIAGGELAGALAYRLFIWFLPFVLVLVAGLGVYADASDQTPREVADELGLAGLVVQSVAAAAKSGARWYALLIGIPVLLYATRSLLRTIVAIHRLAWGLERRRGHLTPGRVLLFLTAIVASLAVAAVISGSVAASAWLWLAGIPVAVVARAAIWLGVSRLLPSRDQSPRTLLPGALVVGVGFLGVNVFTQLVVVWIGGTREDTYGALGLAATMLFSLWLTSRVIVASVVVNATLWSRARRDRASTRPGRS
jgi:uncharacterized BrkB/YihY/UPF0761 family membrane protein